MVHQMKKDLQKLETIYLNCLVLSLSLNLSQIFYLCIFLSTKVISSASQAEICFSLLLFICEADACAVVDKADTGQKQRTMCICQPQNIRV